MPERDPFGPRVATLARERDPYARPDFELPALPARPTPMELATAYANFSAQVLGHLLPRLQHMDDCIDETKAAAIVASSRAEEAVKAVDDLRRAFAPGKGQHREPFPSAEDIADEIIERTSPGLRRPETPSEGPRVVEALKREAGKRFLEWLGTTAGRGMTGAALLGCGALAHWLWALAVRAR